MVKPKFFGGLGFRDIERFNLALLAKQAWRILEDASSLIARILEAVYFPERDFLEAALGSATSRIWSAILDGREVLERGLTRRIGMGETTNIWDMNWIPREGRLCPVRRVLPGAPMLASELINATSATWDRQKLHAHLLPANVEAILNIPLCTRRQDDVWAWHHERSGIFSVWSAYQMLVINKERATAYLESIAGRSDIVGVEKEWLSIWKLGILSNIKVFLWRLAHASIPSADVLHHHNMSMHDKCDICGARDSWKHSLIECNLAKCIWALESEEVVEHLRCIQDTSAYDWLMLAIETL
jgi:hypothetical protein